MDLRRLQRGSTTLHGAAENGHLEVVKLLLTHDADVNAKGEHESTPLHWAAKEGSVLFVLAVAAVLLVPPTALTGYSSALTQRCQ